MCADKKRKISIRFDVDTPLCMEKGVPNLIKLASKYDVKFTFFINTGKAISRKQSVLSLFRKKEVYETCEHLTAFQKLGLKEYIRLLTLNPCVIDRSSAIIKSLKSNGHEVGLHGGRNHAEWQLQAKTWDYNKIYDEVEWGLKRLQKESIEVVGFSSPCWEHPTKLLNVLEQLGFSYVADQHGKGNHCNEKHNGIPNVETSMTGEPGGVAFFEYLQALQLSDVEKTRYIAEQLESVTDYIVVYDHPYFSGIADLGTLELLLKIAKKLDFEVVTMKELVND